MTANGKQALLVMDVQVGIVERIENQKAYLAKLEEVTSAARKRHITVICVVVGFRPGFPEVSPANKSFSALKQNMSGLVEPKPAIQPAKQDILVTKHRVSAFSGSDLDMILRAQGIDSLILCGIATSGVVLSTVREAADKDFRLTVLSDLCADFDEQVHDVLVTKIFPRQAEVLTSQQWLDQK
ncbi:MAG TPA: isochorismatase family cysteine hydrolase [Candidatus Saccharimonadales bacterium]|nr:isochorismatase family cysteine hydrolase [Candidatus Saccharimonadales bacterium]